MPPMRARIKPILLHCLLASVILWCFVCRGAASGRPRETTGFALGKLLELPIGPLGIFDPSLSEGPAGHLWMSYSTVEPSVRWPVIHPHTVSTRLAVSHDGGASFRDVLGINQSEDCDSGQSLCFRAGNVACTENHEVSAIVYDAYDEPQRRWKLFWHRYALVDGSRDFRDSWIAYREAADPAALPSGAQRRLLVGSLFSPRTMSPAGPIPTSLPGLHHDLKSCLVLTEPGLLATPAALLLVLHCADGRMPSNGRIVLLSTDRKKPWRYAGTLLENEPDGKKLALLGYDVSGFSAPDLFELDGRFFLLATPTGRLYPNYRGCLLFELILSGSPHLVRREGVPGVLAFFRGAEKNHSGACSYHKLATKSGVLISEAFRDRVRPFEIYRTGALPQPGPSRE